MNAIRQFLSRIQKSGRKRRDEVVTTAMGRQRTFRAWDVGDDTFIFEKGISEHLTERPSVLVVEKSELKRKAKGWVLTMTTGNHSVAAFPLLDGRFWKLSRLKPDRRGEVLMNSILCCNVVNLAIETSQRDVPSRRLFKADSWLLGACALPMNAVVMGDRNELTLEHYRCLGQEWRVKPLAWTETEMRVALGAAKKKISAGIQYYHSTRGVHFLTYPEFRRFVERAQTDPDAFVRGLRELVSVFEGNRESFTRMPKYRGHHEIELFGVQRGLAVERVIPELEKLMEAIALGKLGQLGVIQRAEEISAVYAALLTRPELADESSAAFVEALYLHVTGTVYSAAGESLTPAFDDRRTALPGATYVNGRPVLHPGADARSEVLLSNLRGLMSRDEVVEYANVYEIRDGSDAALGAGKTREIVYKTSRSPLEVSLIEKRLSSSKKAYGSYMLSRVLSLKSLGIALSAGYRMLKTRPGKGRRSFDFYIRSRCEGEPLDSIPANYFCSVDDSSVEEKEVVLGIAQLMGDAAAQNMAMKKFDPESQSPLFGIGKEIYEFEYDLVHQRIAPRTVRTCSMRGSFGWPDLEFTEENINRLSHFYMAHYAHALKEFQKRHAVTMAEVAERFMDGFAFRTHALAWQLSVKRDQFENFRPGLPAAYHFDRKWNFIMWSLERQERRLEAFRKMFFTKVALVEENKNVNDKGES